MTQRYDAGRTRDRHVLDRWCRLAEQRLDYLVELYESGRWQRFHSEHAFMENLLEAKAAVETWQALARRETPDHEAIDQSRLDQPAENLLVAHDETVQSPARLPGTAAVDAVLTSIVPSRGNALAETNGDKQVLRQTASRVELPTSIVPDQTAFQERYPMLRSNAL
jgi:uncharacterized repeat protein (TIGR03809 family)